MCIVISLVEMTIVSVTNSREYHQLPDNLQRSIHRGLTTIISNIAELFSLLSEPFANIICVISSVNISETTAPKDFNSTAYALLVSL